MKPALSQRLASQVQVIFWQGQKQESRNWVDAVLFESRVAHLKAVGKEVGMREAPAQRPELHDRNEAGQVQHLPLQVLAIADAAQVEQLGACAAAEL